VLPISLTHAEKKSCPVLSLFLSLTHTRNGDVLCLQKITWVLNFPSIFLFFFLFLVFGEGKSGQEMNRGREREHLIWVLQPKIETPNLKQFFKTRFQKPGLRIRETKILQNPFASINNCTEFRNHEIAKERQPKIKI
jgi:hypothetical protein